MRKGKVKAMRLCPENCIYRNHEARFCGYCLIEIMGDMKKKEDEHGSKQGETEDADETQ